MAAETPMNARELVNERRDAMSSLCRRYGVVQLRIFGSALRSDWDPESSDFDFLADFGPPPPGMSLLEQRLGLEIDLNHLFSHRVDLAEANQLKWVVESRILAEALVVYAAR
jgi:hypothetical protein